LSTNSLTYFAKSQELCKTEKCTPPRTIIKGKKQLVSFKDGQCTSGDFEIFGHGKNNKHMSKKQRHGFKVW
jgi:hypothetical protein